MFFQFLKKGVKPANPRVEKTGLLQKRKWSGIKKKGTRADPIGATTRENPKGAGIRRKTIIRKGIEWTAVEAKK